MNKIKKLITKKINKYSEIDYDYLEYVEYSKSSITSSVPRLNLVLPKIDKKYVFGGISTALKIFNEISEYYNLEKRIIVTDIPLNSDLKNEYPDFVLGDAHKDCICKDKTYLCAADPKWRKDNKIPIRKKDYFITTSWRTQFIFENLFEAQTKMFGKGNKNFYLIQDYEPGFFKWSSEFLLVDSTYKNKNTIAIFNSSNLRTYFDLLGYNFNHKICFEPVLNEEMANILMKRKDETISRENIVLIYGRPFEDRNCFSLIVNSLNKYLQSYNLDRSWKFISVGSKHRDIKLKNNFILESYGKLSLKEYADLLLKSKVGISLMCSPHPSYPPLEMSAFGLQTITNAFACKDLLSFNRNIISIERINFNTLSEAIHKAIVSSNSNSVMQDLRYVSNDNQFQETIEFVGQFIGLGEEND